MLTNRPPIIVILGHVDHGKTTLLDHLRQSNIAARESGGITQHIRSFQLQTADHGLLTFIDTPGHATFSAMRQRGSRIADLAVLVISADDGVKPQTRQSLEYIRSSGIPFIVAINKIDLSTADPDRVKTQLTEEDVVVEDLGGQVPAISISAKTGQGVSDLLEMITLVSGLNPPQADPQGSLALTVLESRLDSQKGPLATVVVKDGTLTIGRELFQNETVGKIKAIIDPDGQNISSAMPSQPVEILGLTLVPEVGSIISDRQISAPPEMKRFDQKSPDNETKLNIILRADFAGTLEAITDSLPSQINIISSGTGNIIENDILQARPVRAQVIGFNVRPSGSITKLAQTEKVNVTTFKVIYELLDFLDKQVTSQPSLTPVGKAEVLADFKINADRIAGCRCIEGVISKGDKIQIERAGKVVGSTKVKSLKIGKNDSPSVKTGTEFGAVFSPYVDFKIGDDIIATTG